MPQVLNQNITRERRRNVSFKNHLSLLLTFIKAILQELSIVRPGFEILCVMPLCHASLRYASLRDGSFRDVSLRNEYLRDASLQCAFLRYSIKTTREVKTAV